MRKVRILYVPFASKRAFLRSYSDGDGSGALVFKSRATAIPGDIVILEIRFPGLPNRVLVRGAVMTRDDPPGEMRVSFLAGEKRQAEYLVKIAQGHAKPGRRRRSRRYPVVLPVLWQVDGGDFRHRGSTSNISTNGLYVDTEWAPPAGTDIQVQLDPRIAQTPKIALRGRVVWTVEDRRTEGMGIALRDRSGQHMTNLRRLLREFRSAGHLALDMR